MSSTETFHGLSRIDKDASKLLPELIAHASDIKRMDDSHADEYLWSDSTGSWISPWQASELGVIMDAARLANITKDDRVIDLGCGDGRVLLTLARNIGCHGVGWDVSKQCIETADRLLSSSGLQDLVSFRILDITKNIIEDELYSSSIIFAYLPINGLKKIRHVIEEALRRNTNAKLITNEYHFQDIENWEILVEEGPLRVSRLKHA